ncbi:MAG TPA: SET domain-containing protein-lysine N-methyltransferase, partial [Saprospiraceae bacterium]|nr:SET domain-containing protein-lysine N-methyltransferase [Saprospiraceae bacterium]
MLHPHTELRFIGTGVGYGVFATSYIPQGTITYVKDSLELEVSPEAYRLHPPAMQAVIEKYSYIDERGYRIISWDFAKYIN